MLNFKDYLDYYYKSLENWHFKEANEKAIYVIMTKIFSQINKILDKNNWQVIQKKDNILYIESTDKLDTNWIWDSIFRTALVNKITEEYNLDILTHFSKKIVFENKGNDIFTTQWNIFDIIKLWYKLRWKYNCIISVDFTPLSWKKKFLSIICNPDIFLDYDISKDRKIEENHVQMYWKTFEKDFQNIKEDTLFKTIIILSENVKNKAKEKLNKKEWKYYIWINIWAKNALRNYVGWEEVITKLNDNYNNLVFVLYWKENAFWLDERIEEKYNNIINLVWKTKSLYDVYWIINEMDLNVWPDWGNVNASVALWKNTVIIESIVNWELRVNSDYDLENIIETSCSDWKCYEKNLWDSCTVNEQYYTNFKKIPPCLSNISDDIVKVIEKNIK